MHRPLAAPALRYAGTGDVRTRVRPPPRSQQSLFFAKKASAPLRYGLSDATANAYGASGAILCCPAPGRSGKSCEGFAGCLRWCRICSAVAAAKPALLYFSLTRISTQSDNDGASLP